MPCRTLSYWIHFDFTSQVIHYFCSSLGSKWQEPKCEIVPSMPSELIELTRIPTLIATEDKFNNTHYIRQGRVNKYPVREVIALGLEKKRAVVSDANSCVIKNIAETPWNTIISKNFCFRYYTSLLLLRVQHDCLDFPPVNLWLFILKDSDLMLQYWVNFWERVSKQCCYSIVCHSVMSSLFTYLLSLQ